MKGKRVYVAGHRGMVGSALLRRLKREGCPLLTTDRTLDLREQAAVREWFAMARPEVVILAAAKVGGILANRDAPALFLHDNLMIAANVIEAARVSGVEKLLFLGSSCIYPRDTAQPIGEEALLSGPLESTNEAYAIAKIAGVKLCQSYRRQYGCDFISAMPCNLYGPGDNFDALTAHVLPALIRKAVEARDSGAPAIHLWGSGTPRREFCHVDDCTDGLVFILRHYSGDAPINLGPGKDIAISDLAQMICAEVGFTGPIEWDRSMPDGTMRKVMDCSRLHSLGWQPRISLSEGIAATCQWFQENYREPDQIRHAVDIFVKA
ncbi:NAD-dependent epimerase/dehydratase family protein [Altererythrobacter indicus]|uniref:GDP-L-fucose synthase n=1 Tax=Altericroceibacterium indicum TaxID=374177 RepID=A0A845ADH3_9SPHN|nr:NAD-dependent epimerase/dehydratase family protein [Altericroceibacterium indicum]